MKFFEPVTYIKTVPHETNQFLVTHRYLGKTDTGMYILFTSGNSKIHKWTEPLNIRITQENESKKQYVTLTSNHIMSGETYFEATGHIILVSKNKEDLLEHLI